MRVYIYFIFFDVVKMKYEDQSVFYIMDVLCNFSCVFHSLISNLNIQICIFKFNKMKNMFE